MARMSIDDMLSRDPRLMRLAKACGWSRRETAGALVLDVWPVCYDRASPYLSAEEIDIAAGLDGFADHMIAAGLATRDRRGVRISGAKQRVEYLEARVSAGRAGGIKSGETRRNQREAKRSSASNDDQAPTNPSATASVPDLVPDLVPDSETEALSRPPPLKLSGEVEKKPDPTRRVTDHFSARYLANTGKKFEWNRGLVAAVRKLCGDEPDEVIARINRLFDGRGPDWLSPPFTVGTLASQWNALAVDSPKRAASARAPFAPQRTARPLPDLAGTEER